MKTKYSQIMLMLFTMSLCSTSISSTIKPNTLDCRSGYPEQSTSQYVLPYLPKVEFLVGQGNCTDGSHEANTDQEYAYDFDMPIGTSIVSSRGGVVTRVVEHYSENNDTPGHENYLVIQHNDRSISAYYHLTENGVIVSEGDTVFQGDIIAKSGNTGDSSEPHLHFEVALCEDCETLPVNFKNTRAHMKGLTEGEIYRAE